MKMLPHASGKGGNCGMKHMVGFSGDDYGNAISVKDLETNWSHEKILEACVTTSRNIGDGYYSSGSEYGQLIEMTLTDQQIRGSTGKSKYLKDLGFVLVNRFKNLNSGNWVNVLHYYTGNRDMEKDLEGSPYNSI